MDKKKLGRRIREQREKNHLTLEELAEKVGSTSGYLKLLEYGQRTPSVPFLIAIAKELNCTFDSLLYDYHKGISERFILNDITRNLQGLDQKRLSEIQTVITAMLSYMSED